VARSAAAALGDGLIRATQEAVRDLDTTFLRSAHIGKTYDSTHITLAWDMNLRRLQYFVKIVDIGSLTQAADILHIAQPALSQQ
jgi:hypothetical protein